VEVRRRLKLVDIPPLEADSHVIWFELLRYVLLAHFGMGCRTTYAPGVKKDKSAMPVTVRVMPSSFWLQLGIDMSSFTEWTRTEQARTFGPLAPQFTSCFACDGLTGDRTECRLQIGVPLCINHRDMSQPLDTPPRAKPAQQMLYGTQRSHLLIEKEDEKEEEKKEEEQEYIVDRLLRFMGFEEGRKSTNKVSCQAMQEAVEDDVGLTYAEVITVRQLYSVDISEWQNGANARDVKFKMQQILKRDMHTEVKMVQTQCRGAEHTKTSYWKLQ
jgi:hypothetical protein